MPLYQKIIQSGAVTEIEQYESVRTAGKRIPRSKKKGSTDAEQLERNRINAQKYLCRKVNANFGVGDLFFSLDYKGEEPCVQEARRIFKNFIERLRYYCKTHKMSLKYIAVTENTQSRDGRIHHHVVMNKLPMELIFRTWKNGGVHMERLDPESDQAGIANYISKEDARPFEKRWMQSKGLLKPVVTRKIITRSKADGLIRCPKGYKVVARDFDFRSEGGYWQYAKFIKIGGTDFGERILEESGGVGGDNARADVRGNNIRRKGEKRRCLKSCVL